MYFYVPCAYLVPTEAREVSDSLELKWQMAVSHHVVAGNQIQVYWKSSQGP